MPNIDKNKKRVVVRTTLTAVIFFIGYNMFSPFLTPFLLEKGFNKVDIALVAAFSYPSLIFLSSIFGRISDIVSRKKMINFALALLVISIATIILIGKDYILLVVATTLAVISLEIFSSSTFSRVEDNVSENLRGKFTGIYESLRSFGAMSGALLGSLLIAVVNIDVIFKISLLIMVFIFILGLLLRSGNHNKISRGDFNFIKELKEYWSHRGLKGMAIIGMAKNFSFLAASTIFVPLLIVQELKANISYIGLFIVAISVAQLSQFYFGRKCDIHGTAKINLISMSLYSIAISLLFFVTSPYMVVAVGLLIGLSLSAWNVSADCFMAKIGEKINKNGQIIGSYSSFAYFGVFLGLIASSYLATVLNTRFVFLLYGLVGVISVIIARKYMLEEAKA